MMATINKYLIVSIIILAVGVPAAYAITITLGGDPVIVNGILDMMNNRITNVGTPTVSTDAATKAYVDSAPSTDTLALLGCTNTQIAQFVGSAWTCVADPAIATDVNCVDCISATELAPDSVAASEIAPDSVTSSELAPNSVTGANILDNTITANKLGDSGCTDTQVLKWNSGTTSWNCAADIDTTFDGTDFALSNQACPVGQKATGVDASGSVICAVDIDTAPWNSRVPKSTSLATVDSAGNVGVDTSITIGTDGLPIVSYRDVTNADLKVAHCTNASCSTSTTTTVDFLFNVGTDSSITIGTDGLPIISYHDFTNFDLKVVHCLNVSCIGGLNFGFDPPTAVDTTGNVGQHTSITIGTDGLPIVSYNDVTNFDLKVAHCTNASCSTFDTPTTVDSTGDVGFFTSITIGTDGLPIISYFDNTNFDLKVAHCTNASCSTFDTPTTVDSAGTVGFNTSITIGTDGLPIISYSDLTNEDLKVVHCKIVSCSGVEGVGFDTPTTVDTTGDVGRHTSITIGRDGLPIVSYRDLTNQDLKVAHCTNASCSTFDTPTAVDSFGNVGDYTSITIGTDGLPIVSYYEIPTAGLKVAKCTNPICLSNWIRR